MQACMLPGMLHTLPATSVRQAVLPCRLQPVRAGRRSSAPLTEDSTPQQLSKFLHQQKHSASSLAVTLRLLDAAQQRGKLTPGHVQLWQQLVNKLPSRLESLDPRQLAGCAAQLAHAPSQVNSTPVVQKIARLLSNPQRLQQCPNQQLLQLGWAMVASPEADWLLVDTLLEVLTRRLLLGKVTLQDTQVFTAVLVKLNCCSPAWLEAAADYAAATLEQQHLHKQQPPTPQQQQHKQQHPPPQQQQEEHATGSRSKRQKGSVPVPPSVVLGMLQGLAHFGMWHSRFLAAAVPGLRAVVAGVELWQLPLLAWSLAVLQLLQPEGPPPVGSQLGLQQQLQQGLGQPAQNRNTDEQFTGLASAGESGASQAQDMSDNTAPAGMVPASQAVAAAISPPVAAGGNTRAFWDAHVCLLERAAVGQAAGSQDGAAQHKDPAEAVLVVFTVTGLSQLFHAHLMQLAHHGLVGTDLTALSTDLPSAAPAQPPSVAGAAGAGAATGTAAGAAARAGAATGAAAAAGAGAAAAALRTSLELLAALPTAAGGMQGVVEAGAPQQAGAAAAAAAAAVEQLLAAAEGAWRMLAAHKQQSAFQMEVHQVLCELGLQAALEAPAHPAVPCMTVDVAVQHVERQASPAAASPMQQQLLELVGKAHGVAVEADGPCHFARRATADGRGLWRTGQAKGSVLKQEGTADIWRVADALQSTVAGMEPGPDCSTVGLPEAGERPCLLGATKARNRLLQLLGWRVVDIPFYEWGEEGRHAYLTARLQQACSPEHG